MHEYACAGATVTSEGRCRRCQRVNPALRLNIKLSDQGINNSDGSLSGSEPSAGGEVGGATAKAPGRVLAPARDPKTGEAGRG